MSLLLLFQNNLSGSGSALTKSLADSIAAGDSVSKAERKAATDAATVTDVASKAGVKANTDSSTASDIITKTTRKISADSVTTQDITNKAGNKFASDNVTSLDQHSKALTKTANDYLAALDNFSKGQNKSILDVATAFDNVIKTGKKAVTDIVTATDATAKNSFLNKADFVWPADSAIFALVIAKFLQDSVLASDSRTKLLEIIKYDSVTIEDITAKSHSIVIGDIVLSFDGLSAQEINALGLPDAVIVEESISKYILIDLSDSIDTQDDFSANGNVVLSLSDNVGAIDNSILILRQPPIPDNYISGGNFASKLPRNILITEEKTKVKNIRSVDNLIDKIIKEDDELLLLIRAFLKTQP